MALALATFALVLIIMVGAYWVLVLRPERHERRRLRKRLKVSPSGRARRVDLFKPAAPLSKVPVLDRLLARSNFIARPLQRYLTQAGMDVNVGVIVLAAVFAGLVMFTIIEVTTGQTLVALLFGGLAGFAPIGWVRFKAARRLAVFEEQFPEAMDLISRSLRAGHAFTTGLAMVADELPNPLGSEFRLVHDRQSYGMPLPEALRDMAARVPILDARFFVTAVLTQRESGGNLAEILDNLAALMRERFKVKRQVRAVSAHGRITAWVLTLLAPTIAVILTALAPQHISLMIQDPLGIQITVAAIVMQIIGVFIIRRIVNIEV